MSLRTTKYKNPPIQEAICEIHFHREKPLTFDEIVSLKPCWTNDYPLQNVVEQKSFAINLGVEKAEATPNTIGHKLVARSKDGQRLVQLAGNMVAVNRLRPYLGWEEEFRDTINSRFNEVQQAFGLTKLVRIGLRYINRIEIPQVPVIWNEWFGVPLTVPHGVPVIGGFFMSHFRQEIAPNTECILNFGALGGAKETSAVLLDIDVVLRGDVDCSNVTAALNRVHEPHRAIFESYLLDKTRALFNT